MSAYPAGEQSGQPTVRTRSRRGAQRGCRPMTVGFVAAMRTVVVSACREVLPGKEQRARRVTHQPSIRVMRGWNRARYAGGASMRNDAGMPRSRNRRIPAPPRLAILAIACLVIALLMGLVYAAVRPAPDETQSAVQPVQTTNEASPGPFDLAPASDDGLPPLPLVAPGDEVVFFGDSWVAGHGVPFGAGFAQIVGNHLRAKTTIESANNTGYVSRSESGAGTYAQRLKAERVNPLAKLVVLQGSLSDVDGSQLGHTAVQTIRLAKQQFPNAKIVVLGPIVNRAQIYDRTGAMNSQIGWAARKEGAYFINPYARKWITDRTVDNYIDPTTRQPTVAGHRYLGIKIIESLSDFFDNGQPPRGF